MVTLLCNPTAAEIEAALGAATAMDNCGDVTLVASTPDPVITGCSYSQTRTWNVSDGCGNAATAVSRTVTWTVDTEAPVIAVATATALGCNPTAADIAAAFGAASVNDNCSAGLSATGTVAAETGSGCTYSTTESWTVTDECGNTGTATQTVTYTRDTEAPVIAVATATALGCNPTAADIAAAFGAASVNDNCSTGLSATGTVAAETGSGCTYSTTKSWTVTDECGNTGTATQTVTYTRDTTVPVITLAAASAVNPACNPTAAQIAAAFGGATVTDNCSTGLVALGTVGEETGSGCTFSITKSWTVTDACGNTGTASQTVTYTRDITPPVITCPAPVTVNGNGQCNVTVVIGTATATDNCGGIPTITNNAPASFPVGTTTVTWTATDGCGNTSTCTQLVTVKGQINVIKFFDANGNGTQDAGENGVPNVTFNLSGGGSATTDANGNASFNVVPGTYIVSEVVPIGWTSTTASQTVTIDATHCSVTVKFGDVFLCNPSNGLTLGFWSNKNGNAILTANTPGWVTLLNGLNCLRNADGSKHTFSTVADFNTWILNANATNMAYMLSAQLAANVLDKAYNGLGGNVFVPGGVRTLANVCIVPFLTTSQAITCGSPLLSSTMIAATCGSCSPTDALVTVNNLQARAVCLLEPSAPVHSSVAAGTQRTYEECVKDILDMINNNGNPSGASAYPCGGVKVPVVGGTCPPPVTPSATAPPKPKGGSTF